jgi:O-antigen/teichoic acid export membrane protein
MTHSGPSRLGLNALTTFGSRVAASALAVATGIVIAKTLGPSGKGLYNGVQLLLALPLAISGGFGAALIFALTKRRRTVADVFPALGVLFAVSLALVWIAAAAWSAFHGWNVVTIALVAAAPAALVISWQQGYYVGTGRLWRLNAQSMLVAALTLAGVVVVVLVLRAGVAGALGAWIVCSYGLATVVVFDAVRSGGRFHRRELRERLGELTAMGGQSALNTVLGQVNYRVDSYVLVAMLGIAQFGIYSVATNVGELLFWITRPVATAVSREIGSRDAASSAQLTAVTIRVSAAVTSLVALVLFVGGPAAIDAVYGTRFSTAAAPLRWLLPGIAAFSTAGTFASFFLFQIGRPLIVTAGNAVMIVVQAVACLLLVPRFGMSGAALSSAATYVVGAAVNTWWFCRLTGLHAADVWLVQRSDVRQLRRVAAQLARGALRACRRRKRIAIVGASPAVAALREALAERSDAKDARLCDGIRGADAIVHVAGGTCVSFDELLDCEARSAYRALEAARRERVERVVLACAGASESAHPMSAAMTAYVESLGRLYADKYGVAVACVRDSPQGERLADGVAAALAKPDLHFELFESALLS